MKAAKNIALSLVAVFSFGSANAQLFSHHHKTHNSVKKEHKKWEKEQKKWEKEQKKKDKEHHHK